MYKWWALGDSNPRPSRCKRDALPAELSALTGKLLTRRKQNCKENLVPKRGLEPPSPCEDYHLKVARLPVPPPGHISKSRKILSKPRKITTRNTTRNLLRIFFDKFFHKINNLAGLRTSYFLIGLESPVRVTSHETIRDSNRDTIVIPSFTRNIRESI